MLDLLVLAVLTGNLLGNAHKYGGAEPGIDVEVEVGQGVVAVRVLDRGMGIDETDAASLFERFYRTKEAEQTAGGVGLGLSVCQRIVEGMGGQIWARSRAGGGSEFGFSLPISAEPLEGLDDRTPTLIARPGPTGLAPAPTGG
ncbi:MAG: ATP-binding protein [Chloroflexota bacterium]|nr:ATP-binding protein [Chloroflexota bacterium]